jgi:phosphoribosylamine---glycine ligase
MNILLLGSGGREHALAWKLVQSPRLSRLFIAPGNAGTGCLGTNLPLNVNDFPAIKKAVTDHQINMVVVGPEDPLVHGIHDFFLKDHELRHIPVIGPTSAGAQLEGSKDFAKQFMLTHNIPTARYETFDKTTLDKGFEFLKTLKPPYVLKADGLAAGKGVVICHSLDEATGELTAMLRDERFGNASAKVVIEEFLEGIELSAFIITDGLSWKILPEAKDYKKIGEGDTGPNTGGMGSVSPVPFADESFMKKVEERVIARTMNGLKAAGIDYSGFLFFGLMNVKGDPYVIEYNCRLGDPETESIVPRITSDLIDLFEAVASRSLGSQAIGIDPRCAFTVMLVSAGYPNAYEKGKIISGEEKIKGSLAFHAGTIAGDGMTLTNGGRVIAITSLGNNMKEARERSYQNVAEIAFEGKYYRKDIGFDL